MSRLEDKARDLILWYAQAIGSGRALSMEERELRTMARALLIERARVRRLRGDVVRLSEMNMRQGATIMELQKELANFREAPDKDKAFEKAWASARDSPSYDEELWLRLERDFDSMCKFASGLDAYADHWPSCPMRDCLPGRAMARGYKCDCGLQAVRNA